MARAWSARHHAPQKTTLPSAPPLIPSEDEPLAVLAAAPAELLLGPLLQTLVGVVLLIVK